MVKSYTELHVADFEQWRNAYEAFLPQRIAAGEKLYSAGILNNEAQKVFIINGWESIEAFEAYSQSPAVKAHYADAGVIDVLQAKLQLEVENSIH